MPRLFQGQKIYKISVTDSASTAEQVVIPTTHYKAYVEAGGSDVIIKWGTENTVAASAAKTGNVFNQDGIDILPSGTIQTLQRAGLEYNYFSAICESGGTATLWVIAGEGE